MKILLAAAICASLPVLGGNLVFNSSFELGEKGWNGFCERQVPETFERKVAERLWGIDSSTAHSGRNSLKVSLKGAARRTAVFSHDIPVEFGKTYTVSFYAKGSRAVRCPVRMRSCMVPPRRAQDGSILPPTSWGKDVPQVKTHFGTPPAGCGLTLTPRWKRYSFSFTPERDFVAYTFSVDSGYRDCTVWIDDVQVEEGSRMTAYRPASPLEIALDLPDRTVGAGKADGTLTAISYDRAQKSFPLLLSLYNLYTDQVEGMAGDAEDQPLSHLWEAVLRLPGDQRAVVTLYYYEDLPVKEIARILGVAQGTVKSRLGRARARLKQMLREEEDP